MFPPCDAFIFFRGPPAEVRALVFLQAMSNHFDSAGHPRMVDVTAKPVSPRVASAEAFITAAAATIDWIRHGESRKGDVLAVARLAGIMAAKQTHLLIPLCHPLPIEGVEIDFDFPTPQHVRWRVTVRTTARTGVEMEALTAASTIGLTIYDMCKSMDRAMEIGPIRLLAKSGGASGTFPSPPP